MEIQELTELTETEMVDTNGGRKDDVAGLTISEKMRAQIR